MPSFSLIFQGQEETRDTKTIDRTLENYVARIYTSALYQDRNRRVDELLYDFSYHLRNRDSSLPNEQHFELNPDPNMIEICAVEKKHKVFCCFVLSLPLKAIQGQNPVACVHNEYDIERT